MGVRRRSWWQKVKQHRVAILIAIITLLIIISLIVVGYHIDGTGFNRGISVTTSTTTSGTAPPTVIRTVVPQPGKTLWDWLQLLIIPTVLAVGGYVINLTISRGEQEATKQRAITEREIANDNQREATLQGYIDKMSELLLHEKLRQSPQTEEVRTIARVRTLTTLLRLDENRKRSVLQFLYESRLIDVNKPIIALSNADLSGTDLSGADLSGTDLSGLSLVRADLRGASLLRANLGETDLRGAKLSGASLCEADLRGAKLSGANLSNADLNKANLGNADLGDMYPNFFDIIETYLIRGQISSHKPKEFRLGGADLRGANLTDTNLTNANLTNVYLNKTNLTRANLSGANLSGANLGMANLKDTTGITIEALEKQAKSLEGAIMPDGSRHP